MILNNNSTQQINTLVIQLQNKITNLNNELKSLNKEIDDLDTKISDLEIRDSSQENDTAAMNAEIKANTKAISGKADKNHTHIKSEITDFPTSLKNPNALTVNGKTYDGSTAVDAGVQTVANGGTGVTTQAEINKAFIANLEEGESDVTDGTEFVSSWANDNGFSEPEALNKPYKRKFSKVWGYIKDKISSVLGLTKDNYGGTAKRSKNMYYQYLDLSSLDKTKFYPLVCYSGIDFAEVAICSESFPGSYEYNQNRIHFDISTKGWHDLPYSLNIREYVCFDNNEITIGCIGRGLREGGWAIWLRGGLHYTCFSRDSDLSLKTSDYTYDDETYTIGTNYYGGSNNNVSIIFTPQSTITDGAYSSRGITATEIKANNRLVIPIGAPSSLEDGCIWIER